MGFVGELLKGVVKEKLAQGGDAYDKWIEEAKAKTRKRAEQRGGGGDE